ncbi:MAG: hypothetical protein SVO01_10390, partial [Thermotogota bacterium]|nr:hypothetical protein [Thermotogota bacterium]
GRGIELTTLSAAQNAASTPSRKGNRSDYPVCSIKRCIHPFKEGRTHTRILDIRGGVLNFSQE